MEADRSSDTADLRKAAILVASLDPELADSLLATMSLDQAVRVRDMADALGPLDADEQEAVIRQFVRAGSGNAVHSDSVHRDTVELTTSSVAPPFGFWLDDSADRLAPLMKHEHPQTIAVVMAHLPRDQAAELLRALDAAVQTEVVERLLALDETDPEIIRDVERGLRARLAAVVQSEQRREAGTSVVAEILQMSDAPTRDAILSTLKRNRQTTQCSPAQRVAFCDVERLSDEMLAALLNVAEPEMTELALAGASRTMVRRVMGLMTSAEAKRLARRIERLGPIRLSDVERAQAELARLVDTVTAQRDDDGHSTLAEAA
jgi:flagellar motor switch protein FliG